MAKPVSGLIGWIRAVIFIMLGWMLCGHLAAQADIPGQDAPEFQAALTAWLADDDAGSLPVFAAQAKAGNVAARILLGLIDKNVSLQGPWLALVPKKDRIALLRVEGGLSGSNWLRLVKNVPLATLWVSTFGSVADIETALAFADLGEIRAVRAGLVTLEARQVTGFSGYEQDARFPDALRYLIWREWQKAGNRQSDLKAALSSLPPGDPQRMIIGEPPTKADLADWLLGAGIGQPLQQLCLQNCPSQPHTCVQAGFTALGGYRRLITLGTPLAALISESDFAHSPRGQRSVLRRALFFAFLTESRLDPLQHVDACFSRLLEDEGQKF